MANSPLHPEDSFTLNLWGYAENWKSLIGCQLAGNYYIGGFGIFYNDGVSTPQINAFWDETSGWIGTINQEGNIVSQRMFDQETNFDQVLINSNKSIYLLDNKNHKIIILDTDLVEVDEINLQNSIKQMEIGPNNSIYALTKENHILKYTQGCSDDPETIGGLGFNACWDKIYVDKDGGLTTARSDFPIFSDCSGNTYFIYGNNLYKNGSIFYHLISSRAGMTMDFEDNIYVYYGAGKLLKISSDGKTIYDTAIHSITETTNTFEKISMSLSREYEKGVPVDYLWITMEDRNYILKVSTVTGRMVKCIQIPLLVDLQRYSTRINIQEFKLRGSGDMTGYELARKSCGTTNTIQGKITLLDEEDSNCDTPITVSLNYDSSELNAGWHMFTLIFNKDAGTAKLYVDGIEVAAANNLENHKVFYKYNSPFLVGADSGKFQPLQLENQVKNPIYFNQPLRDIKLFEGVIDPKILKGGSLLAVKSETPFFNGPFREDFYALETIEKFLVNKKPAKSNKLHVNSAFLNSLPPTCSQKIKDKILEENEINPSMVLVFDD
jgi:hypothetical protein